MKRSIWRNLFCTVVLSIFVLPIMGNTACASEYTFFFDGYNNSIKWITNPGNMADGDEDTYASTTEDDDVQQLINNTCTGSESGTIDAIYIRAKAYYTGASREVVLQPVFPGGDGDNHSFYPPLGLPNADWSSWFEITDDTNSHSYWTWRDVKDLVVKVKVGLGMTGYTVYVSKVEIKVEYT